MRTHRSLFQEIIGLLRKELLLEWKQKYAFNGLMLYVVSMVVVVSLAFVSKITPMNWNMLYWLIMLFSAINVIAKSFMSESSGQLLYMYTLARPEAIILAKMIYNSILMIIIGFLSYFLFATLSQVHIYNPSLLALIIVLGSIAFSATLTLVSAIAAKAENRTTLLAVLSFPIIIPLLLSLIKNARYAIEDLNASLAEEGLWFIGGTSILLIVFSVVLFPVVWRA